MRLKRVLVYLVTIVLFVAPTSCTLFDDDVKLVLPPAAIHVTAISVTNWEEYVDNLLPNFKITPEEAFSMAVPETLLSEQLLFDAFRNRLSLKLAPSVNLPAGYGADDTAGQNIPESKLGERPGPTGPSESSIINREKLKVTDPFLQYWAASSLYQEVKLINRYLQDVNYNKKEYKPYIVQFLVNQVPYKGRASFDTHLTMSFFNTPVIQGHADGGKQHEVKYSDLDTRISNNKDKNPQHQCLNNMSAILGILLKMESLIKKQEVSSEDIREKYENYHTEFLKKITAAKEDTDCGTYGNLLPLVERLKPYLRPDNVIRVMVNPIVIPMLVTDQVEAAVMSRRAERLQQMALTLAAAYAGIGGEIDLDKTSQDIQSAMGTNFNSRFTIGRVNENTVRIIFSARQTPSQEGEIDYVAEKRNHRVSLLVLVPNKMEGKNIYFGTRASFVDPKTGQSSNPSISQNQSAALLSGLIPTDNDTGNLGTNVHPLFDKERHEALGISIKKDVNISAIFNRKNVQSIESMVRNNDYKGYVKLLLTNMKPEDNCKDKFISLANSLWIDLSELVIGSQYATGKVFIKSAKPCLGKAEKYVITDDGKMATAVFPGVTGIYPRNVRATWSWKFENESGTAPVLEANKIELEGNGRTLKISFDSPVALGMKVPKNDSSVTVYANNDDRIGKNKKIIYYDNSGQMGNIGLKFKVLQKVVPPGKDSQVVLIINAEKEALQKYQKQCEDKNVDNVGVKKCVIMTVENAKISPYTSNATMSQITYKEFSPGLAHAITGTGVVTLKMSQLVAGEKITLRFAAPNGYKDPEAIEITVKDNKPQ